MKTFRPRFPSSARLAAAALAVAFAGAGLRAQTAITSITTTFTTGTSTNHVTMDGDNVTMDKDALAVNTMTDSAGNTYTITGTATAAYARTDLTHVDPDTGVDNPNQVSAWYMGNAGGTNGPSTLLGTYNSGTPGSLLLGNNLLQGTDNLFNNGSDANSGPVERLDMIYNGTTGFTSTGALSLAVFDRGTGDSFSIAIITGVDANGNPTSYGGNLVSVDASDFGGSLLNSSNSNSTVRNSGGNPTEYILRYDSTTSLAAGNVTDDTTTANQNISGVILHLSDFGIASGTKIYGYSIMAGDVTDGGNINNLVNYNNTTYFPTNTNDSSTCGDAGGLDAVAVNGVFFQEHPIPEPATYGLILCGLGLAAVAYRRLRPAAA